MATTIKAPSHWETQTAEQQSTSGLLSKWYEFTNSQSDKKTLWFLVSLVFQGVFFLPIPAVLVFFYEAPVFILGITLALFFANVIAGMGGANIKTLLGLLACSVFIHVLMLLVFML